MSGETFDYCWNCTIQTKHVGQWCMECGAGLEPDETVGDGDGHYCSDDIAADVMSGRIDYLEQFENRYGNVE